MIIVAGSRNPDLALIGCAGEGRPNVFLGVRELGQWDLHCHSRLELAEFTQQPLHNVLVFAIPRLWNIRLKNGCKVPISVFAVFHKTTNPVTYLTLT
jgi:hypothetical protein